MARTSVNRRIFLILAIIIVLLVTYAVTKKTAAPVRPVEITIEAASGETTLVTRVIDGDTIEVEGGRRVRYIGIDTPEITDCFGVTAKDKNSDLVAGKPVRLVSDISDKDAYGRLLRYVYAGDIFVNDTLVRQGFAAAEPIKPDIQYASQFLTAQNEAKQEHRGIWQACKSSVDTPQ